jgi:hypothetical protein
VHCPEQRPYGETKTIFFFFVTLWSDREGDTRTTPLEPLSDLDLVGRRASDTYPPGPIHADLARVASPIGSWKESRGPFHDVTKYV